ncbi:hypothetical protein K3495_g6547 [Podosphaera aphanis]|nr:hypothetical protein K3495_g6547 [Podosphaera aphanis]
MICRCISRAAGLFYQTGTEVNIPTTFSIKQVFTLSHRPLASVRYINAPISSQQPFGRAHFSSYQETAEKTPSECLQKIEGCDEFAKSIQASEDDYSDAFVELSPEGIDQLAAEVAADSKFDMPFSGPKEDFTRQKATPQKIDNSTLPETTPLLDLMSDLVEKKPPRSNIEFISITEGKKKYDKGLPNLRLSKLKAAQEESERPPPRKERWMIEKERIKAKYPDGYMPLKRLSPDAIDGIRALHAHMPERFTTATLAKEFKVSPEVIQRILRSKWRPTAEEAADREARWHRRGEQVWSRWADLGASPPARYRKLGIGQKPHIPQPYKPDPLPELITTSVRPNAEKKSSSEPGVRGGIL